MITTEKAQVGRRISTRDNVKREWFSNLIAFLYISNFLKDVIKKDIICNSNQIYVSYIKVNKRCARLFWSTLENSVERHS